MEKELDEIVLKALRTALEYCSTAHAPTPQKRGAVSIRIAPLGPEDQYFLESLRRLTARGESIGYLDEARLEWHPPAPPDGCVHSTATALRICVGLVPYGIHLSLVRHPDPVPHGI